MKIKKRKYKYRPKIKSEAYPEEMLIACQNGVPCSYGICDECPNMRTTNVKENENEDEDI